MKRRILLLFACWSAALTLSAQTTDIRELFKQMPDSLFPYLSLNNRLDCIDFMDSGMEARVANTFGGQTQMEQLNDQFISMKMNDAVTMQMRVLPVSVPVDDVNAVICMVTTYGTSARESVVRFYSCKWTPLKADSYIRIDADELLKQPADMTTERFDELKRMLQPYQVVAELSRDADELVLTVSNQALTADEREQTNVIILQTNLKWNGEKFNKT